MNGQTDWYLFTNQPNIIKSRIFSKKINIHPCAKRINNNEWKWKIEKNGIWEIGCVAQNATEIKWRIEYEAKRAYF